MSEIVNDFIKVIEQQPELFSVDDKEDLRQRTWSDDTDELEDEILDWYETRDSIASAAMKNLSSKDNDKSFAGEIRLPGNGTKAPEIKPEDYKPMLLNAIHRSFDNVSQTTTTVSTNSQ
ncbi:MAG: hypothetical protein AAGF83_27595 [Cyanobacteria bacterium P01_G01_bin.67]